MGDYILSSESTMDIDKEFADKLDVRVLFANYEIDGEFYLDDFGQSLDMDSFYKSMEEGAKPSTSGINTQEFINHFRSILDEGRDIIHVTLSSGLSRQYKSLLEAVDSLKNEYPDRRIYPIDSRMGCSGIGLLVSKLSRLKKEGMTIEELNDWALANRLNVINYTSNSNLEYVARGGRVSKTAANIGTMLQICPLIEVSDEGELIVTSKIRTERKLLDFMVKSMKTNAIGSTDYADEVYIASAKNYELANKLKKAIKSEFPNIEDIPIFNVGPTIGSHIGPGAIGLFYWGEERLRTKK